MFDDLQDLLGISLSEGQKVALKELARRKNDTLQVYNPLPDDYYVEWGLYDQIEPGGLFLIPGKDHDIGFGPGRSNQPRYIATKFFKEAAMLILQSRQRIAIDAENTRRKNAGFARLNRTTDNDEETQFLSQEGLMITHDKFMELLPIVILGIVHEWGLDTKPIKRFQRTLTLDELQQITDRKVGTPVDPNLMGVTKIQEKPVETPAPVNPAPVTPPVQQAAPVAPTTPQTPQVPAKPEGDPLQGVAA